MAMMMGNLYHARLAAGVSDEKATEAAAEVAGFDSRISNVEARLALLTWMIGVNIALTLIVIARLFVL